MEYNRRQQRTNKRTNKKNSTSKCMATNESRIRNECVCDVRVWLLTLPLIISSYNYCVDASDSDNMCPWYGKTKQNERHRTAHVFGRCLDLCLYFSILEIRLKRSSHSMACSMLMFGFHGDCCYPAISHHPLL